MEGVIALVLIFGLPPIAFVASRFLKYRHEEKMKALDKGGGSQGQVKALQAAKSELEGRVRNLESIVCDVDFELNAKLNRLATRQMLMLPSGQKHVDEEALAATERIVAGTVSAGQRVANRFVIERQLGAGGMGAVYLARDDQLGESVALKVIAGFAALDPSAADRLRREASAARRISHSNVVRLHDIGEEHGMLFLSMEFVTGQSLAELISRHGVLPLPQTREVALQVCEGLSAAHAAAVIHRDLKPANILVDEARRVKIIDFGLARIPHVEGMTATGMIVGTPEYMAPEQIKGGTVDARSDIYALGAVLCHALTGRPPFTGDNAIAIGLAHCAEPVPSLRELRPDLPEPWQALVLRALEKDPGDRFDSAASMAAALPAA